MATFSKTASYTASAASVWDVIKDFGGIADWLPPIQSCEMAGQGVGAVRTLALPDGAKVVERLDAHDDGARAFSYTINDSPFPMRDYSATMKVNEAGGGSQVVWSCGFEPVGVSEQEMTAILEGVFDAGFDGIKQAVGG